MLQRLREPRDYIGFAHSGESSLPLLTRGRDVAFNRAAAVEGAN